MKPTKKSTKVVTQKTVSNENFFIESSAEVAAEMNSKELPIDEILKQSKEPSRLFKLQPGSGKFPEWPKEFYENPISHIELDQIGSAVKDKVCLLDGITLFILDPECKEHVKKNAARYKLIGNYDYETDTKLDTFTGKFRNFDIYTAGNSTGHGVVLGGSLHKWKNKTHNYDVFYWQDFIQVYNEILEEFCFDPSKTRIWVLEAGLNNHLLPHWTYQANSFPKNTIYLKGDAKETRKRKHARGGATLDIEKGSCTNSLYDKGRQNKLDYELLRTECSCKRKTLIKLGIDTFESLLKYEIHQKLAKQVIKTFETLLLFQPEVLQHPELTAEDKMFFLQFNSSAAWVNLRKEKDSKYQKARIHYLELIDKYAPVNYQREILKVMKGQLE